MDTRDALKLNRRDLFKLGGGAIAAAAGLSASAPTPASAGQAMPGPARMADRSTSKRSRPAR
jgi:hypothetical protein